MKRVFGFLVVTITVVALGCGEDGGGCEKDNDCKGDRTCVDGECVDPGGSGGDEGGSAGAPGGSGGEGGTAGGEAGTGGSGGEDAPRCPRIDDIMFELLPISYESAGRCFDDDERNRCLYNYDIDRELSCDDICDAITG